MIQFIYGAIMMACVSCGLFFFKFWRTSRDRLFLSFALAFWILALERVALAIGYPQTESAYYIYTIRLVAFALIAAAIVDKNRNRPS